MPHIHTGFGEHDHTASAYIVRTDTPEPRLLLHVHKKLHRLLQPGGHIETNENPWQAIIHELTEETGYDISQLQILQPKDRFTAPVDDIIIHPQPMLHNTHAFDSQGEHYHTDVAYAFTTDQEPAQELGEGESSDMRWYSAGQLEELSDKEIYPNTRRIGLYVLQRVVNTWEPIDTATFSTEYPSRPKE